MEQWKMLAYSGCKKSFCETQHVAVIAYDGDGYCLLYIWSKRNFDKYSR